MARSVPEWHGQNMDSTPPPRVRLRVFERADGRCHRCNRKISSGEKWTLEHLTALINGGENREQNLSVTCDWCVSAKNAEDVAEKSQTYKKKLSQHGIKKSKSPVPGSRGTKWRRKMDGTVERRD